MAWDKLRLLQADLNTEQWLVQDQVVSWIQLPCFEVLELDSLTTSGGVPLVLTISEQYLTCFM